MHLYAFGCAPGLSFAHTSGGSCNGELRQTVLSYDRGIRDMEACHMHAWNLEEESETAVLLTAHMDRRSGPHPNGPAAVVRGSACEHGAVLVVSEGSLKRRLFAAQSHLLQQCFFRLSPQHQSRACFVCIAC